MRFRYKLVIPLFVPIFSSILLLLPGVISSLCCSRCFVEPFEINYPGSYMHSIGEDDGTRIVLVAWSKDGGITIDRIIVETDNGEREAANITTARIVNLTNIPMRKIIVFASMDSDFGDKPAYRVEVRYRDSAGNWYVAIAEVPYYYHRGCVG